MHVFQTYIAHPKCVVKATKTMLLKEDTSERCEVNVTAKRKKEKQKKRKWDRAQTAERGDILYPISRWVSLYDVDEEGECSHHLASAVTVGAASETPPR